MTIIKTEWQFDNPSYMLSSRSKLHVNILDGGDIKIKIISQSAFQCLMSQILTFLRINKPFKYLRNVHEESLFFVIRNIGQKWLLKDLSDVINKTINSNKNLSPAKIKTEIGLVIRKLYDSPLALPFDNKPIIEGREFTRGQLLHPIRTMENSPCISIETPKALETPNVQKKEHLLRLDDSIIFQKAEALIPAILKRIEESEERLLTFEPDYNASPPVLKLAKQILEKRYNYTVTYVESCYQQYTMEPAKLAIVNPYHLSSQISPKSLLHKRAQKVVDEILHEIQQSRESGISYSADKVSETVLKQAQIILLNDHQLKSTFIPGSGCQWDWTLASIRIENRYYLTPKISNQSMLHKEAQKAVDEILQRIKGSEQPEEIYSAGAGGEAVLKQAQVFLKNHNLESVFEQGGGNQRDWTPPCIRIKNPFYIK